MKNTFNNANAGVLASVASAERPVHVTNGPGPGPKLIRY